MITIWILTVESLNLVTPFEAQLDYYNNKATCLNVIQVSKFDSFKAECVEVNITVKG